MPAYGASIKIDTASIFVNRIRNAMNSKTYAPAIGEAGKLVLMNHFAGKESDSSSHATATRLGAKPIGLFSQFARSTSWKASGTGVLISIAHNAIRQRLEGGEIKPVKGKYLSLPAIAGAYGKRIADFGDTLKFGGFSDEQGRIRLGWGLREAVKVKSTFKRKGKDVTRERTKYKPGVYFWAVRKVNQKADPTVLPGDGAFMTGLTEAVGDWLEEQDRG